ncbi:homoserine kinase [mine drainage metagenome]|uniref:Homoserine kinase n=1 Tax=mine drainage metagenome TaxID=410659 RepID=A0A1J5Q8G9_9ZZZZ
MTEIPGLDLPRLRAYLETNAPQLAGDLSASLIPGGRSNLTYFVSNEITQYVLRRPPLGHVLTTAHDMGREFRVMSALSESDVPVPKPLLLCEDESVIGAPFYLMSKVEGSVYRTKEETASLTYVKAQELSADLIEILARLHKIDPAKAGLGDFGKVEGFLERQLGRWQKQLASSNSRQINGIGELAAGLSAAIPETKNSGIIHGDFRLDNCIINSDMKVAAVVDWEMSTLGDCLSDVGLFVVYWDGIPGHPESPISGGISAERGFPSSVELLERYAAITGFNLDRINWYVAFGFFKLAVILEGIHFRYNKGQTVGTGFEEIGNWVDPLVAAGVDALNRGPNNSPGGIGKQG